MLFHFTFKHMDSSEALQSYAEAKITEKITKFVTKPIDATVVFSVQRHQHTMHLSLRAGDGFNLEIEQTSPDMYATVDLLIDKLGAQLKKHKEKLKEHKLPKTVALLSHLDIGLPLSTLELATENEAIDASDIVKYERGRQRASAH